MAAHYEKPDGIRPKNTVLRPRGGVLKVDTNRAANKNFFSDRHGGRQKSAPPGTECGKLLMRIKVVLADGRKILREGQALLLEKYSDIKIVGEVDEPAAAPALVRAVGADVAVL